MECNEVYSSPFVFSKPLLHFLLIFCSKPADIVPIDRIHGDREACIPSQAQQKLVAAIIQGELEHVSSKLQNEKP